ncbi:hypothetical protein [Texcoconibacillus texcoconensis]|uniref:Prolipoprotein diacylglyceryl transferase n=1 Tax=Texcoconibacillus texcoconensis TaxID=1095777 RepID=A0A840QSF5_9BACI|nr:hypothetical protein [Texcoconibacillus texcoconensis]MBB5174442.1 hypothetical protein [Texcoconibacillus texcoconensis]
MFAPYETFNILSFSLQSQLLLAVVAIVTSYAFFTFYVKRVFVVTDAEAVTDHALWALLIGAATFKFWPFFTNVELWPDWRNFIYYVGGGQALIVALIVGAIYFCLIVWRKKWSVAVMDGVGIAVLFGMFTFSIFVKTYGGPTPLSFGWELDGRLHHPVNLYRSWLLLLAVGVSILWIDKDRYGQRALLAVVAIVLIEILMRPFVIA